MTISNATREHARELAYLINLAGEGIPALLWQRMAAGGESPLDVGAIRAAREEGSFSYRNARVYCEGQRLLGMALAYRLPDPYAIDDIADYPAVVQPLVLLEAKAPDSWYINAIATYEHARGRGVATALMADADRAARAAGCRTASLIVASANETARRLYGQLGYTGAATRPMLTYPGCPHTGDWVLMIRDLREPAPG